MTVTCRNTDLTFDRDPALEVPCPMCSADVGQGCKRPSGWSGPFVKPHRDRDLLMLAKGITPPCPGGDDPMMPWEAAEELGIECEVDDPLDPESYEYEHPTTAVERYLEHSDTEGDT